MTNRESAMFKCRSCGAVEFTLVLQSSFQGDVQIYTQDSGDVIIKVNDKEFIADLMFMNQFALCKGCDAIHCWEYYYPQNNTAEAEGF